MQRGKIWTQISYEKEVAETLYKSLGISFRLSTILAQKGIKSQAEAEKFLYPKLSHLDDPIRIRNIDEAVDILQKIIKNRLSIAIIGDYDVDGITSVTLLINVLKNFEVMPDYFVPRRDCEGYGISTEIIDRILTTKRYDVVIALDCGTNAVQEVEFLKNQGIEVLVIDHHQSKSLPVADCCIVNPHICDDEYFHNNQILCSVGLVFKLCHALLRVLRKNNEKRAFNYLLRNDLDLVTLGTIADMSQLVGENRIFCKFGLKILSGKSRRPGIEALCKTADIPSESIIAQPDVSFRLCPRLNACGRLGDAALPISMLLSDDIEEAMTYAYELDETNRERQLIEREITHQAAELVDANYVNDNGLVLYDPNWHSGVVGIISGKFAKDYGKPCIVFGKDRDLAKGSGRSAHGINLIDVLSECSDDLEAWGGHPYAVGISISPENIEKFRKNFNAVIEKFLEKNKIDREIEYCLDVELEDINRSLIEEIENLQPFGQKNSEPKFLLKNVSIGSLPETFGVQKSHIKFWLADKHSKRTLVIGWNFSNNIPPIKVPLDFLVTIRRETWNKGSYICLNIVDWRISDKIS